jgi:hypothetical protein
MSATFEYATVEDWEPLGHMHWLLCRSRGLPAGLGQARTRPLDAQRSRGAGGTARAVFTRGPGGQGGGLRPSNPV